MLLIRNIRLPLTACEGDAIARAVKMARLPAGEIASAGISKLSVDARHGKPTLVYTVAISLRDPAHESAYLGNSAVTQQNGFFLLRDSRKKPFWN